MRMNCMKPLTAQWMIDLHGHLAARPNMIIDGFHAAGILKQVQSCSIWCCYHVINCYKLYLFDNNINHVTVVLIILLLYIHIMQDVRTVIGSSLGKTDMCFCSKQSFKCDC